MTAPITGRTTVYGLEYPLEGEGLWTTRQKWERAVKQVEAALLTTGTPPPTGATWTTISTDSGWVNITAPASLPAGLTSPGLGRRYRVTGRTCQVQVEVSGTWADNAIVATGLPAPNRAWWHAGVRYGGTVLPAFVDAAGALRLSGAQATASGGFLCFDYPIG